MIRKSLIGSTWDPHSYGVDPFHANKTNPNSNSYVIKNNAEQQYHTHRRWCYLLTVVRKLRSITPSLQEVKFKNWSKMRYDNFDAHAYEVSKLANFYSAFCHLTQQKQLIITHVRSSQKLPMGRTPLNWIALMNRPQVLPKQKIDCHANMCLVSLLKWDRAKNFEPREYQRSQTRESQRYRFRRAILHQEIRNVHCSLVCRTSLTCDARCHYGWNSPKMEFVRIHLLREWSLEVFASCYLCWHRRDCCVITDAWSQTVKSAPSEINDTATDGTYPWQQGILQFIAQKRTKCNVSCGVRWNDGAHPAFSAENFPFFARAFGARNTYSVRAIYT